VDLKEEKGLGWKAILNLTIVDLKEEKGLGWKAILNLQAPIVI